MLNLLPWFPKDHLSTPHQSEHIWRWDAGRNRSPHEEIPLLRWERLVRPPRLKKICIRNSRSSHWTDNLFWNHISTQRKQALPHETLINHLLNGLINHNLSIGTVFDLQPHQGSFVALNRKMQNSIRLEEPQSQHKILAINFIHQGYSSSSLIAACSSTTSIKFSRQRHHKLE